MTKNIDEMAMAIPLTVIKTEIARLEPTFKSRRKPDCIRKLKQLSHKMFEDLAVYYSSVRENKLFICKINQKHRTDFKESSKVIDKLRNLRYTDGDGNIYEVKNISHKIPENAIFFKVVMHSGIKSFSKEKPNMDGDYNLKYRDKTVTTSFLHLSPFCLEVRTGRVKKVELTLDVLNKKLFGDEQASGIYALSEVEKRELAGGEGLKFKEAVIKGLSLEGCDEITLKGEDVDSTLNYFEERGINLKGAREILKSRVETANQQFRFYESGKITVKKRIGDPFAVIEGVVFRNGG